MSRTLSSIVFCVLFSALRFAIGSDARALDDTSTVLDEVARTTNQSLLWGPYRPNLYFGVRPRIPRSLQTGLMWAKVDNFQNVQSNFRYTCEQHEGMAGYGWDEYDVRTGGRQTIHDAGNNIDLHTEFVKIPGGTDGGSWAVRIKGVPREDAPPDLKSTVVFSVALDGLGSLEIANEQSGPGYDGTVTLEGNSPELGEFTIDITPGSQDNSHPVHKHPSYKDKPLDKTLVQSYQIPGDALWQLKAVLFTSMKQVIDQYIEKYGPDNSPPPWQTFTIAHKPGQGNLHLIQKVFEGPFEFDVLFSSGSSSEKVTSEALSKAVASATGAFKQRFAEIFTPAKPFQGRKYEEFARSMFSNLVGGIGYFYGDAIADRSYASEYEEESEGFWEDAAEARARGNQKLEGPYELFTSIPSRPFFPRGFLWDEGFHLIPVFDWDTDLTLDIVKSWFNLMDEDGWIAREQILGPEARSKVPEEFQVQYPHYANPPTLFFILQAFVDRLKASNGSAETEREAVGENDSSSSYTSHVDNPKVAMQFLQNIYPLLKRHYSWFRKTQWGDIKSYDREAFSTREAYRWRGRTPRHILPSGLDDYPRAQPPHPGELHVDLISWMGMMSRSLKDIAAVIGEHEDVAEFAGREEAIVRNIDDLHWDETAQAYCDATIDEYEESVHVCHKGYLSIFPFLVGLLPPDSARLGPMLDLIEDPEELWSEYGIRSLSKRSEFYGTDENYWRSPVWINMNFLIIQRLLELAQGQGPHQAQARRMYGRLRLNVVENVFREWNRTGFAWEQYHPETGAGQRTQHFTGWTSLVVKIMAMPDLAVAAGASGAAGASSPRPSSSPHDEL